MKQPHDNWGKHYDFVYESTFGGTYKNLTSETIKSINETLPKGTIIDFGAGTGRLSFPLAKEGYSLIAVEKSRGMAEEFKRKMLEINLDIDFYNCSNSDYNNGQADLALALFTVLSYSITEDELSKNVMNICKHIKENGYFFFDLPNRVFFNTEIVTNIHRPNLKRSVKLTRTNENDIYSYKEICSGIYNRQDFNYEDEFRIRYWTLGKLNELLVDFGFLDTKKSFNQFNSTGSTYKLYKKL